MVEGGWGLMRNRRSLAPRQRGKRMEVGKKLGPWRTVDGRREVSEQCVAWQEEEWGSGQRHTRGRGGGGVRSVRQGTAAREPTGRSGGGAWATAAMSSAQKNSNIFDLFKGISKRSDLIRLKDGLSELEIFQIKYGCEGI
jgi:hypothetical protein